MSEHDPALDRRHFLGLAAAGAALAIAHPVSSAAPQTILQPAGPATPQFELSEMTVADLQDAMHSGRFTARSLTDMYLGRIDELDKRGPAINAVIELNPDAQSIADALDDERKQKGSRGPLHGVPVLIKDNIDTADRMHTTAGSLALADNIAVRDAWVAERLRAAGAVIIGKTNLSEWANFRSTN